MVGTAIYGHIGSFSYGADIVKVHAKNSLVFN